MPKARSSIARLMSLVLACGVGVAALHSPTPLWTATIYTLALALLGLAVPGLIYRTGPRRAFWVGFAAFGWGYWFLALSPWIGDQVRPHLFATTLLNDFRTLISTGRSPFDEDIQAAIRKTFLEDTRTIQLTTRLEAADQKVARVERRVRNAQDPTRVAAVRERDAVEQEYQALWQSMYMMLVKNRSVPPAGSPLDDSPRLERIGHSLFALLMALGGGFVARSFYRTRDAAPCPDDEPSPSTPSMP